MNTCLRQKGLYAALVQLAGVVVIAGCISFDTKEMDYALNRTIGLPLASSIGVAGASHIYRQDTGRWPTSMEDLRTINCTNTEQRQLMSNFLGAIEWKAITNSVFKTLPDGTFSFTLGFAGGTASTNGTSVTWNGGSITATLDATNCQSIVVSETPNKNGPAGPTH